MITTTYRYEITMLIIFHKLIIQTYFSSISLRFRQYVRCDIETYCDKTTLTTQDKSRYIVTDLKMSYPCTFFFHDIRISKIDASCNCGLIFCAISIKKLKRSSRVSLYVNVAASSWPLKRIAMDFPMEIVCLHKLFSRNSLTSISPPKPTIIKLIWIPGPCRGDRGAHRGAGWNRCHYPVPGGVPCGQSR